MYTDLLGKPFKVHGRTADGYDCYGLAMEVLKRNGIDLPEIPYDSLDQRDEVREQIFSKVQYEAVEKPCINCIIEIMDKGSPNHVAVYIGEGKIIHAVKRYGVVIEPLHKYEHRIKGVYKVIISSCI